MKTLPRGNQCRLILLHYMFCVEYNIHKKINIFVLCLYKTCIHKAYKYYISSNVGGPSCFGNDSCKETTEVTVGDNSCVNYASCTGSKNLTAGTNSCRDAYSCQYNADVIVGDGSCRG